MRDWEQRDRRHVISQNELDRTGHGGFREEAITKFMQNLMSCNTREEAKKRLRNADKQHLSLPKYVLKAGTLSEQWRETPDMTSMQAGSDCAIS